MNEKAYPVFVDKFYTELFCTWSDIHFNEPANNEEVCRQIIGQNSFIQVGGKEIHYQKWQEKNIEFIQDLIDRNGDILSQKNLEEKFDFTCNFLEYQILKKAIPSKWKRLLRKNNSLNLNYHVFHNCTINIDQVYRSLDELNTNALY